ncbi:MAG TPA: 30S ribosomal protein S17 [Planctomycetota bacterium]|jgi:small subunit ribosomal protein S17|nr:30S ribosomal protein S17 [Planctomycetota bacterium]MDP7246004.1 30S ribosomal protein S17 [Planctomycetota bacterium]HJM38958.1 30S ribosomal protein S17 [Planctomycetota bacterium]|tara:strand:- start:9024 stop:9299 length:276 start_codon:yes stop_codon:yes gene_type:complete
MTENQTTEAVEAMRGTRKLMTGTVLKNQADKTIVVQVERTSRHPLYKKTVRIRKKFYAHDEENVAQVGDKVQIMGTRPLSKLKCWRLVKVL